MNPLATKYSQKKSYPKVMALPPIFCNTFFGLIFISCYGKQPIMKVLQVVVSNQNLYTGHC